MHKALTIKQVNYQIPPEDTHVRKMIVQPASIIFGSTTYLPKEKGSEKEYEITEPLRLGEDSFDLIFTDTKESRQHILPLLPEQVLNVGSVRAALWAQDAVAPLV